nr:WxL domain-containing protein [Salinicoccus sp. RF5]
MVFEREVIQSLKIEEILDTNTKISGTTVPHAEVTIADVVGITLTKTKADIDGKFTFNLDERFEAGTVLRFDAKLDNAASETVEKTVIGNRLEFGHVSTSIPFNTTEIKDEEMKIYRQNDNPGIEIVETREDRGWKLSVEATTPLTNENQDTLENALYYFSAGSEPELIEGTPVPVARGMTSETIEWVPDEGILLKLNPIRAAADTEYKTTIKWILSDGP